MTTWSPKVYARAPKSAAEARAAPSVCTRTWEKSAPSRVSHFLPHRSGQGLARAVKADRGAAAQAPARGIPAPRSGPGIRSATSRRQAPEPATDAPARTPRAGGPRRRHDRCLPGPAGKRSPPSVCPTPAASIIPQQPTRPEPAPRSAPRVAPNLTVTRPTRYVDSTPRHPPVRWVRWPDEATSGRSWASPGLHPSRACAPRPSTRPGRPPGRGKQTCRSASMTFPGL